MAFSFFFVIPLKKLNKINEKPKRNMNPPSMDKPIPDSFSEAKSSGLTRDKTSMTKPAIRTKKPTVKGKAPKPKRKMTNHLSVGDLVFFGVAFLFDLVVFCF